LEQNTAEHAKVANQDNSEFLIIFRNGYCWKSLELPAQGNWSKILSGIVEEKAEY